MIWQRILEISALSKCNIEMFETGLGASKWGQRCQRTDKVKAEIEIVVITIEKMHAFESNGESVLMSVYQHQLNINKNHKT